MSNVIDDSIGKIIGIIFVIAVAGAFFNELSKTNPIFGGLLILATIAFILKILDVIR